MIEKTIVIENKIANLDNLAELRNIVSNLEGIKHSWINLVEEVLERELFTI